MAVSTITAVLDCDLQTVWEKVTSLKDSTWRSDLDHIDIIDDLQFIEVSKDGYRTKFTTTVKEPCSRWEFDMDNENMKGHWCGIFSFEDGKTTVIFTEDITPKKMIMKPFVKRFLKKQQETYVRDLKQDLSRK